MTISLCVIAKNEEHCIHLPFSNMKSYVDEMILLDDYSKDNTAKIASSFGARIVKQKYPISKTGFAKAANFLISEAVSDWIIFVDADEMIDNPAGLYELQRYPDIDCWSLPRRKWTKYPDIREEYEAYPDWQPKFFRNIPENRFEGEMHVSFCGAPPKKAYRGPHIEHLQTENRTKEKARHRVSLYEKLSEIQGVEVNKGSIRRK